MKRPFASAPPRAPAPPPLAAIAALIAASSLAPLAACEDEPASHVFLAQPYEPTGDCLDPSASIDLVQAPGGSLQCAPACLVGPSPVPGVNRIYVSTMCPPFPSSLDASGADPACAPALAAFARGATCGAATGDAGADATDDGGEEGDGATTEASDDATTDGATPDAGPR